MPRTKTTPTERRKQRAAYWKQHERDEVLAEKRRNTPANLVCRAAKTLPEALAMWKAKQNTLCDLVEEGIGENDPASVRLRQDMADGEAMPLANWLSANAKLSGGESGNAA